MAGKGRSTCCWRSRARRRWTCAEISILALVEQYLGYVEGARALKLELAADYLVMAAWLALLKSALLLPKDPEADPDPEELAARLALRLQRLDAMREAGARLMARDRIGRDVFLRAIPKGLRVVKRPAWQVDLYELLAAYGMAKSRTAPVLHIVSRRPVMTLDEALRRMRADAGTHRRGMARAGPLPAAHQRSGHRRSRRAPPASSRRWSWPSAARRSWRRRRLSPR